MKVLVFALALTLLVSCDAVNSAEKLREKIKSREATECGCDPCPCGQQRVSYIDNLGGGGGGSDYSTGRAGNIPGAGSSGLSTFQPQLNAEFPSKITYEEYKVPPPPPAVPTLNLDALAPRERVFVRKSEPALTVEQAVAPVNAWIKDFSARTDAGDGDLMSAADAAVRPLLSRLRRNQELAEEKLVSSNQAILSHVAEAAREHIYNLLKAAQKHQELESMKQRKAQERKELLAEKKENELMSSLSESSDESSDASSSDSASSSGRTVSQHSESLVSSSSSGSSSSDSASSSSSSSGSSGSSSGSSGSSSRS